MLITFISLLYAFKMYSFFHLESRAKMTHPAHILSYEMFSRINMSLSLILHLQIMVCDNDIQVFWIFLCFKYNMPTKQQKASNFLGFSGANRTCELKD